MGPWKRCQQSASWVNRPTDPRSGGSRVSCAPYTASVPILRGSEMLRWTRKLRERFYGSQRRRVERNQNVCFAPNGRTRTRGTTAWLCFVDPLWNAYMWMQDATVPRMQPDCAGLVFKVESLDGLLDSSPLPQ